MQIRNKYYPYPVIAYGNDSYDGSEFVSDANYAHDAHNIKFQLEAVLTDDCLSAMIANGQVKYAHHIECQQTCFRTLTVTDRASYEFKVHESKINGLVQICSFLMADQDIQTTVILLSAETIKGSNSILTEDAYLLSEARLI